MNEIQRIIQAAVDREHEIQRKRVWLAFFASLALVITLAAVLDRMWFLSGLARWSGWLVGLTVAAWMAWRAAWFRWCQRVNHRPPSGGGGSGKRAGRDHLDRPGRAPNRRGRTTR